MKKLITFFYSATPFEVSITMIGLVALLPLLSYAITKLIEECQK